MAVYRNFDGTTRSEFSIGKDGEEVYLRTSSGVLEFFDSRTATYKTIPLSASDIANNSSVEGLNVSDALGNIQATFAAHSGDWESTYYTVMANSGSWALSGGTGGSDVSTLSSNWQNTWLSVAANSAVWSAGEEYLGDSIVSTAIPIGSTVVDRVFLAGEANGCLWDYCLKNGLNTRAGSLQAFWSYTDGIPAVIDVSTNDIGSTLGVSFSGMFDGSAFLLSCNVPVECGDGWTVKLSRIGAPSSSSSEVAFIAADKVNVKYSAAAWEYSVRNIQSASGVSRIGTVRACWNTSGDISLDDTSTNEIGDTSIVNMKGVVDESFFNIGFTLPVLSGAMAGTSILLDSFSRTINHGAFFNYIINNTLSGSNNMRAGTVRMTWVLDQESATIDDVSMHNIGSTDGICFSGISDSVDSDIMNVLAIVPAGMGNGWKIKTIRKTISYEKPQGELVVCSEDGWQVKMDRRSIL